MIYVLEIKKKPYRKEDYLAFVIYEASQKSLGGALMNYKIIKHYEKLGPLEEKKEGNFVSFIDINENDSKLCFSFDRDLIGQIVSWAASVNKKETPYERQFEEFKKLIVTSGEFRKL